MPAEVNARANRASLAPAPRPTRILLTCCLSVLLVSLDTTIVNVALPAIRRDLHATVSGLQWTIDAYTLVVASLLMLAGALADRFGRRRVFQCGLALFGAGSLLCSFAPDIGGLIACRILQALGGAVLTPVAMSIIVHTYPEPKSRARAIGLWGAISGLALAIGPVAGGMLTYAIGWRSVFWVNVPVVLGALVMSGLFLPGEPPARTRRLDPVGLVLLALALAALIGGIIEGPRLGWQAPLILGLFAVAAAALTGLVAYEFRCAEPLIDPRFFRSAPFTGALLIAICAFAAFGGFLFLSTLYLQESRGLSAFAAGLCTVPLALGAMLAAPLSGRAVGAWGVRPSFLLTGICYVSSAVMLATLSRTTPLPFLLSAYAIFGIGFGAVSAPISTSAVSGMPRGQAGVVAGLAAASRQVGVSFGVAATGILLGNAAARQPAALPAATHPAWWSIGGCGLAIMVLAIACTSRWGLGTTRHVSHLLGETQAAAGQGAG